MSNAKRAMRTDRKPTTTAELRARRVERANREAERRTPTELDTARLEAELHADYSAWGVAR